jgi:hypothetical protein
MSIAHIVHCNAKYGNGMPCEIKALCPTAHVLPVGWIKIHAERKATFEDQKIFKSMQPVMDVVRDKALAKDKPDLAAVQAVDAMMANSVESALPVLQEAHVCPEHAKAILAGVKLEDYTCF